MSMNYETLNQALVRLRTHPVGATLYEFKGWDGPGIYRGPMKEGAEIEGLHAVIMCELRMIDEVQLLWQGTLRTNPIRQLFGAIQHARRIGTRNDNGIADAFQGECLFRAGP